MKQSRCAAVPLCAVVSNGLEELHQVRAARTLAPRTALELLLTDEGDDRNETEEMTEAISDISVSYHSSDKNMNKKCIEP